MTMVKPDLILQDLKVALRSLWRTKGLSITVILTLALGIGANAAIFRLVRGVSAAAAGEPRRRPADLYPAERARARQLPNTPFFRAGIEGPEVRRARRSAQFGDFSTISFTMVGLGEPREVRAGVVGGSYFDVMGLQPALGRLLGPQHDDGPMPPASCVLTYRFWTKALQERSDRDRQDGTSGTTATATIIGVLEPSVPYPAETEIIANVVTSPHHLSATMVTGRVHRMTELFGRLAPGATLEQANAELRTVVRLDGEGSIQRRTRPRHEYQIQRDCCATRSRRARRQFCWCCWQRRDWSS